MQERPVLSSSSLAFSSLEKKMQEPGFLYFYLPIHPSIKGTASSRFQQSGRRGARIADGDWYYSRSGPNDR
jgi:hypothetical protein